MRPILTALLLTLALTLTSCKTLSGDRSEAPTVNTVTKNYSKSAQETWAAVQTVAKELDLKIDTNQHDALGGTLVASRSNDDEVHIDARSQDAMNTSVSVWAEPGDKSLAQIIHDRIGERLGLNMGARASVGSGSQVEGTYEPKVDACMKAAEQAIGALKLAPPRREVHDTWARMDTAHLDSIPVSIRMERTRKDQTFVVFSVGTGASDDNQTLAARLKSEFEKHLNETPRPEAKP